MEYSGIGKPYLHDYQSIESCTVVIVFVFGRWKIIVIYSMKKSQDHTKSVARKCIIGPESE
jgi:hypothetical protein